MTQYLMTVHGPAEIGEFGSYGSKEEMEQSFADTGAFNDRLKADGHWVFAGGLETATTREGGRRPGWRRRRHRRSLPGVQGAASAASG